MSKRLFRASCAIHPNSESDLDALISEHGTNNDLLRHLLNEAGIETVGGRGKYERTQEHREAMAEQKRQMWAELKGQSHDRK